jgi:hypothetical protein
MRPRRRIPAEQLRRFRNKLPIRDVIEHQLALPSKEIDGIFRFLCPHCNEFNTATNPRTNLARCFRYQQNFNPIDIVMAVERCSFIDAVRVIEALVSGGSPPE